MSVAAGTVSLDTGTRLAVDRTRLAYERTLMAWVRTAASLPDAERPLHAGVQPRVDHPLGLRATAADTLRRDDR